MIDFMHSHNHGSFLLQSEWSTKRGGMKQTRRNNNTCMLAYRTQTPIDEPRLPNLTHTILWRLHSTTSTWRLVTRCDTINHIQENLSKPRANRENVACSKMHTDPNTNDYKLFQDKIDNSFRNSKLWQYFGKLITIRAQYKLDVPNGSFRLSTSTSISNSETWARRGMNIACLSTWLKNKCLF